MEGSEIVTDSELFQRDITDRRITKLLWVIYNLNDTFVCNPDETARYLRSPVVKTQDGSMWVIELRAT